MADVCALLGRRLVDWVLLAPAGHRRGCVGRFFHRFFPSRVTPGMCGHPSATIPLVVVDIIFSVSLHPVHHSRFLLGISDLPMSSERPSLKE